MSHCLKVGLVGLGKIARDQHLPAIAATDGITLAAIASRNAGLEGVPCFHSIGDMLRSGPAIDAVILCQPPAARFEAARSAIEAGKHVFLEKPPGATVREVETLAALAARHDVTLFAGWHSRYAAGVATARRWIADRALSSIAIEWREDIRQWHPGQDWILEPDGFGVFDPGINALAILTTILDDPIYLTAATLAVPANRGAPISASLRMTSGASVPIIAKFDFLHSQSPVWDIRIDAGDATLRLWQGGERLTIDGVDQDVENAGEYPEMYRRFVDLVTTGQSDADVAPLQLVADAFRIGQTIPAEPFAF